jgi:hypothetical protein
MIRLLTYYTISGFIILTSLYIARATDYNFTVPLFTSPWFETGTGDDEEKKPFPGAGEDYPLQYKEGDWSKYIIDPLYERRVDELEKLNLYKEGDVNINAFGSANLDLRYGKSVFTDKKYKQYDEDEPVSRVISSGFTPEQVVLLYMEGEVGERIKVFIDHDSRRKENRYLMQYRAVEDDEVVREINTGEIDIEFNHSKYAVYDNRGVKGLGADFTLAKSGLRIKGFGSVSRGESEVEYFNGSSSPGNIKISEYQYLKRTYYQLEPFIRYDGVSSAPAVGSIDTLITATSEPPDPETYAPYPVNISPSGFELYMDDQNPHNNYNAVNIPFDGGYYTRLVNGTDYSINYTTGVIKFLKNIPESSRIFAAYNVNGGTKDPYAESFGGSFTGKNIVFIKYGYSLGDIGKRDVYEIRSYFYIGARNILPSGFSLNFYRENSKLTDSEVKELSRYSVDRSNGIISFATREPFRPLLGNAADIIYSEVQPSDVYIASKYRIGADYNVEARSFQLKHFNIIENSVKVKINGKEISSSLYSVDYYSGFLVFTDPNNPLIATDTSIEIKYEYLPFGTSASSFMGGVRADYDLTRDLRIGGTVLVSRGAESEVVPDIGSESDQTVVFEGDASLNLGQKRLADMYNAVTGGRISSVPLEIKAYGEVAKSFKNTNIFGKALIDNMESTDEVVSVSLSEKDWQLSSMPDSQAQLNRGIMNYFFYRDPWSPETLKGPGFTPYAVPYSVKPGPYNIAMGHINNSIVEQSSQRSLVFDFDFTDGEYVSVVTRKLSDSAVDMSGLQYVEMWVKYEGSDTNGVDLFIDLGTVNEDSDEDGQLDTEDRNGNSYIDSNPSSGYSEDRGYSFNGNNTTVAGSGPGLSSYTRGDGVLNTEDLNSNGVLDISENVYKIEMGTIGRAGGNWQRLRFYVNQSDLSAGEVNLLKQVTAARMYLYRNSDNAGKLYVSSLKFVASKWKNPEADGTPINSSDQIKVTRLNSVSDPDYRAESFMFLQRNVYESLYGSRSSDDIESESESALLVDYEIPGGNSSVSVTRTFASPFDIRNYKTMNIWVNPRVMNPADSIGIIIGSSEYDYVEYRTVPANMQQWANQKLKLKRGSDGNIDISTITGNPDFRRVKYIKLVIYGNGGESPGKIWINDIYVSEPETLTGDARWYEGEVAFKRPVYVTDSGVPVLSDMRVKYVYRGYSSDFTSPGKGEDEIEEKAYEVSSSFNIIPGWGTSIDYTKVESVSDSRDEDIAYERRGDTEKEKLLFTTAYRGSGPGSPSINFSYAVDRYNNLKDRTLTSDVYTEESSRDVHTPVITYRQKFVDFLGGVLNTSMMLNMAFSHISMIRFSDTIPEEDLKDEYGGDEKDRRQRSELLVQLDYAGKYFFLRPKMTAASEEVVEIKGDKRSEEAGINDELSGGYNIPFTGKDMKYLERKQGAELVFGLPGNFFISPEVTLSADYREESFSDYDEAIVSTKGTFFRSRDAGTLFSSRIRIPFKLEEIPFLKNVKQFQVNYFRGVTVNEEGVPYEGEGVRFYNEKYGFPRVFSNASGKAFNLFDNYPGIYFTGRGNFARGRDMVYGTMNKGVELSSEAAEYNNTFRLVDDFSMDISFDTGLFDVTVNSAMGQVCERSNIFGIPNQVVTYNCGALFTFDLMDIFSSGFFRSNSPGKSYHSSSFDLGLSYTDRMFITSNIDEKIISPEAGILFKWDRSSLSFKGAFDYREKKDMEFINYSTNPGKDDYIYITNMPQYASFHEKDYGYKFTAMYETDVSWVYDFFSMFYKLTALPVFSAEYNMALNRYDYFNSVSPEPYDLFMAESSLTMDLHKNVKGGVAGALSLERFRNRDDQGISREVFSFEISANITILF